MSEAPEALRVEVPAALGGVRLDRAVALLTGLSRSAVRALVEGGAVRLDGEVAARGSVVLEAGADLVIEGARPAVPVLEADPSVAFDVVASDADVVVVDKPWDLVVHPGAGQRAGTLASGILARFPDVGRLAEEGLCAPERPGIVHRLDRGTSGLLVVARTPRALASLGAQMAGHSAERRYVALVRGEVAEDRGVVDAPLGRSLRRPTQMAVSATGRPARTSYVVLRRYGDPDTTLLDLALDTGRTHQIRVHMAAIGHPVVGDERYGERGATGLARGRFFLHAYALAFDHPADGRRVSYRSALPEDLADFLKKRPALGS